MHQPFRVVSVLFFLSVGVSCKDKNELQDSDSPVVDTGPDTQDSDVDPVDEDRDGYTSAVDCDDGDAAIFPGAVETCDGIDNNCDGEIDEAGAEGSQTWYADTDGDGFGDASATEEACDAPAGFVGNDTDCDDADPRFNPGAIEQDCEDATDWNCDGSVGFSDADADGFAACRDCNDADASVNEDAEETCDGVDNDCNGFVDGEDPGVVGASTWYGDADGDGYGGTQFVVTDCDPPTGYVASSTDCDDLDATTHPGAGEVCDTKDNDCDGDVDEGVLSTWYADVDGDGFGDAANVTEACTAPAGYQANGDDCDDTDAATSPAAYERCDGIDNDCDLVVDEDGALDSSTWYPDADGDGYGDAASHVEACEQPSAHADNSEDCNDADSTVNPGAAETCNSVDEDCDGSVDEDATDATTWYQDLDGDGVGGAFFTTTACSQPSGYEATSDDCDDLESFTYPGAAELCDSRDNDCDGTVDEEEDLQPGSGNTWFADADGDGYGDSASLNTACAQPANHVSNSSDCNDSDANVAPGEVEVCNGVDDDCNGAADEADSGLLLSSQTTFYADVDGDGYGDSGTTTDACFIPSGYSADATDCDDAVSTTNPGATEVWYDGVDGDCAGGDDYDADADGVQSYQEAGGADCDDSDAASTNCGGSAASALASCQVLLTVDPSLGDGNYWINPDGVTSFQVECDMTTDTGGWIVLETDRTRNYWDFSYDSGNNTNKCGYDGLSTQTNGNYTHDAFIVNGCPYQASITWFSASSSLSTSQVEAIRAEVTALDTGSALFWADCDSDGYEPSWEAYAVAEDGTETRLSSGASGNSNWNTGTYTSTTELDIKYLLPSGFRLNEDRGCDNGGGVLVGFRTTEVRVR